MWDKMLDMATDEEWQQPEEQLFRYKPAISREDEEVEEGRWEEGEDTFDDEPDKVIKNIGKTILKHGKIRYRHITTMPEWMQKKREEICQFRTPAQLRRCLQSWMVHQDKDALSQYRNRKLGWKTAPPKKAPQVRTYGPEDTMAYSYYFMGNRYGVQQRIFAETKQMMPNFKPKRVLDFGCGPATALAAALEVWAGKPEGVSRRDMDADRRVYHKTPIVQKYTGVDVSRSMIEAATIMAQDLPVDSVFFSKTADVLRAAQDRGDRYDLIVAAYSLSEMASDPARKAATQVLYELLDVGGVLVIVEQGNPKGSHTVRTARQFILNMTEGEYTPKRFRDQKGRELADEEHDEGREQDTASLKKKVHDSTLSKEERQKAYDDLFMPSAKVDWALPAPPIPRSLMKDAEMEDREQLSVWDLQARVVAPCTHDKKCPLGPGHWCSFSQRVKSSFIRIGAEEKFSYVVMQKVMKKERSLIDGPLAYKENEPESLFGSLPDASKSLGIRQSYANAPAEQQAAAARKMSRENWTTPHDWTHTEDELDLLMDTDAYEERDPTPLEILHRFGRLMDGATNAKVINRRADILLDEIREEMDWEDYNPPMYRQEWSRIIR
jgi:ribosomal protein RSM22 (predicted rRNA methylase)